MGYFEIIVDTREVARPNQWWLAAPFTWFSPTAVQNQTREINTFASRRPWVEITHNCMFSLCVCSWSPPDIDSCSPRSSIYVLNLKNKENFASLYVCIFCNIGANWENGNWRLSQSTLVLLLLFWIICLRHGLTVLPSMPGAYAWTKLALSLEQLS